MPRPKIEARVLAVLTREQAERVGKHSEKLMAQLPNVEPMDLVDTITELMEPHLDRLLDPEKMTLDQLYQMVGQLSWWNVLLLSKLTAVVLKEENPLIVPPGDVS